MVFDASRSPCCDRFGGESRRQINFIESVRPRPQLVMRRQGSPHDADGPSSCLIVSDPPRGFAEGFLNVRDGPRHRLTDDRRLDQVILDLVPAPSPAKRNPAILEGPFFLHSVWLDLPVDQNRNRDPASSPPRPCSLDVPSQRVLSGCPLSRLVVAQGCQEESG